MCPGSRRLPPALEKPQNLLAHPDGPNQKVDGPLEKRGFVAFDSVAEQQQDPPAHKQGQPQLPSKQDQEHDSRKNYGDSHSMQQLVPWAVVLVFVLRDVGLKHNHRLLRQH